jgi:hypothetical protein
VNPESSPRRAPQIAGVTAASLVCSKLFIANFPGPTVSGCLAIDKGGNNLTNEYERPHEKKILLGERKRHSKKENRCSKKRGHYCGASSNFYSSKQRKKF